MVDAGSGLLDETTPWLPVRPPWLHDEPGIRQAIEAGAAVVTFSGDKLLGGPQAGIIVGRADAIAAIARHPLARADARRQDDAGRAPADRARLPVGRRDRDPALAHGDRTARRLRARAERIAAAVGGAEVVDTEAVAGGGSLPGLTIPSVGVAVEPEHARRRDGDAARPRRDRVAPTAASVVCDLRSVDPDDDRVVAPPRSRRT